MSEFLYSSSINVENWMAHIEEPILLLPTITPSKATLEALENIAENTIPLLGFAHPNRGPIPSFVRNAWEPCEQTPQLRDLAASSSPTPLEGHLDFGPIERPIPDSPPTPRLSPVQRHGELRECYLDAQGPSRLPYSRLAVGWPPKPNISPVGNVERSLEGIADIQGPSRSGPKQRHDSYFPYTPIILALDDGDEPTEFSLGNLNAS